LAKLGEARLGEVRLAEPAELELIDDDVEERAKEVIKSAFPTHEGTTWDQILDVILYEFRVHHTLAHDVMEQRFIDRADGEQIDMIGRLWGVERELFERDDSLRARIKSMFPRHTSRATINEVIHVLQMLLVNTERELSLDDYEGTTEERVRRLLDDTEEFSEDDLPDNWESWPRHELEEWLGWYEDIWMDDRLSTKVKIRDNFWFEPASFLVEIEQDAYDQAGIRLEQLEEILDAVSAAGVRPILQIGALFTHAGVVLDDLGNPQYGEVILEPGSELSGEPYGELYGGKYGGHATYVADHDPDKGYGSLDDPMLGGEYKDLIHRDLAWMFEMRNNKAEMRGDGFIMVHGWDMPNFINVGWPEAANELTIEAPNIRRRNRSSDLEDAGGVIDAYANRNAVRRAGMVGTAWMNTSGTYENNRQADINGTATITALASVPGYGSDYSGEYGGGGNGDN
jgi:hypothetical protein